MTDANESQQWIALNRWREDMIGLIYKKSSGLSAIEIAEKKAGVRRAMRITSKVCSFEEARETLVGAKDDKFVGRFGPGLKTALLSLLGFMEESRRYE